MTTAQFRAQAGKPQMTQSIFHITVATLVGTMAVFGTIIATAPSRGGEAAKPAPAAVAAPVAAAIQAAPVTPPQALAAPVEPSQPAAAPSDPRLDGCVIQAISRLPKADGLRVTNTSHKFYKSQKQSEAWVVYVSVDVHGHQATYNWMCLISEDYPQVVLVNMR